MWNGCLGLSRGVLPFTPIPSSESSWVVAWQALSLHHTLPLPPLPSAFRVTSFPSFLLCIDRNQVCVSHWNAHCDVPLRDAVTLCSPPVCFSTPPFIAPHASQGLIYCRHLPYAAVASEFPRFSEGCARQGTVGGRSVLPSPWCPPRINASQVLRLPAPGGTEALLVFVCVFLIFLESARYDFQVSVETED